MATPLGFKLVTRAHPAYEKIRTGQFEPDETRIFGALLQRGELFVDVGNPGYYCCLALQMAKPVIAVEPQAQDLECLLLYPVALSSAPGILTLFGASALRDHRRPCSRTGPVIRRASSRRCR